MNKKSTLLAVMVAAIMMFSACGSASNTSSTSSDGVAPFVSNSDTTAESSADGSEESQVSDAEESEEERTPESFGSLSTYQIEFNEKAIKFPIKCSEFESLTGFIFEEGHSSELESDSEESIGVNNGEFSAYIQLKNFAAETAGYQDCYVIGFMVTMSHYFSDEGFSVVFPDGITLWESTREEVYAAYGKPTRAGTGTLEDTIHYTIENGWRDDISVYCSYEFEFDDDDVLTDFSMAVDMPPVLQQSE